MNQPVSLRDLPATVMDQVGLSAGSPFPGRSLTALWLSRPGQTTPETSPALSEMAPETEHEARSQGGQTRRFQMSLVAPGQHYIRDGTGAERLFDLKRDPYETANLADLPDSSQVLRSFRARLLNVLTDAPGAIEVENACLRSYRERLEALVKQSLASSGRSSARDERSRDGREESQMVLPDAK